jgi:hypothetical protein
MKNKFIKLDRPDKLDTKGWDINFRQLLTPRRGIHPYIFLRDELFESPNEKYACLFYTINEYRMGAETSLVGIFGNKNKPILLANPKDQWFDYQGDRSFVFSDNFLFLRKLAYNKDKNHSGTPFTVLNLDKKEFGFVDFDFTSCYYSLIKKQDSIYQFNLDMPNEIKNIKYPSRHGQTFDLTKVKFYSFDKLDSMLDIYFKEKELNAC